ncbi:hypothetical protein ACG0Z6_04900 [Roseateles sp. BYS180W]|uniref:Uncharacterized protein n=1 Tax=Roseateles rivi TaxID=3299028 RepID=A0ABW7FTE1_9BURK
MSRMVRRLYWQLFSSRGLALEQLQRLLLGHFSIYCTSNKTKKPLGHPDPSTLGHPLYFQPVQLNPPAQEERFELSRWKRIGTLRLSMDGGLISSYFHEKFFFKTMTKHGASGKKIIQPKSILILTTSMLSIYLWHTKLGQGTLTGDYLHKSPRYFACYNKYTPQRGISASEKSVIDSALAKRGHVAYIGWRKINSKTLRYDGVIDKAAANELAEISKNGGVEKIEFNSSGGLSSAGMDIGMLIAKNKYHISIKGYCISACANYIFPSGSKREIYGIIAYHGGIEANLSLGHLHYLKILGPINYIYAIWLNNKSKQLAKLAPIPIDIIKKTSPPGRGVSSDIEFEAYIPSKEEIIASGMDFSGEIDLNYMHAFNSDASTRPGKPKVLSTAKIDKNLAMCWENRIQ